MSDALADLIERCGDLKGELVTLAQSSRWSKQLNKALRKEFGATVVADEEKLINFIDRFVLQHRLPDGRTLVEHFVANHPELSPRERETLLAWQHPVEGIFEVERLDGDALVAVNLIDELTYRIRSNMGRAALRQFPLGSFLLGRIVPVGDEWLLSGAQAVLPEDRRAQVLRIAAEQALRHPELLFRNRARLARAWEMQRWERERFIEFFGDDLVIIPGSEVSARMQEFWEWRLRLTMNASTGGTKPGIKPAPAHKLAELPEDLTEARNVAVIYDDEEGLTYLAEFGLVEEAFDNPELAAHRRHRRAVLGYLEDDSVSTLAFRRLAERDTEKASKLFQRLLNKPRFSWPRDGEALLRKHKPGCFDRDPQPRIAPLGDELAQHLAVPA